MLAAAAAEPSASGANREPPGRTMKASVSASVRKKSGSLRMLRCTCAIPGVTSSTNAITPAGARPAAPATSHTRSASVANAESAITSLAPCTRGMPSDTGTAIATGNPGGHRVSARALSAFTQSSRVSRSTP